MQSAGLDADTASRAGLDDDRPRTAALQACRQAVVALRKDRCLTDQLDLVLGRQDEDRFLVEVDGLLGRAPELAADDAECAELGFAERAVRAQRVAELDRLEGGDAGRGANRVRQMRSLVGDVADQVVVLGAGLPRKPA
jgi:hypothetical protein